MSDGVRAGVLLFKSGVGFDSSGGTPFDFHGLRHTHGDVWFLNCERWLILDANKAARRLGSKGGLHCSRADSSPSHAEAAERGLVGLANSPALQLTILRAHLFPLQLNRQ